MSSKNGEFPQIEPLGSGSIYKLAADCDWMKSSSRASALANVKENELKRSIHVSFRLNVIPLQLIPAFPFLNEFR